MMYKGENMQHTKENPGYRPVESSYVSHHICKSRERTWFDNNDNKQVRDYRFRSSIKKWRISRIWSLTSDIILTWWTSDLILMHRAWVYGVHSSIFYGWSSTIQPEVSVSYKLQLNQASYHHLAVKKIYGDKWHAESICGGDFFG
jgi:hypothetical protein